MIYGREERIGKPVIVESFVSRIILPAPPDRTLTWLCGLDFVVFDYDVCYDSYLNNYLCYEEDQYNFKRLSGCYETLTLIFNKMIFDYERLIEIKE